MRFVYFLLFRKTATNFYPCFRGYCSYGSWFCRIYTYFLEVRAVIRTCNNLKYSVHFDSNYTKTYSCFDFVLNVLSDEDDSAADELDLLERRLTEA